MEIGFQVLVFCDVQYAKKKKSGASITTSETGAQYICTHNRMLQTQNLIPRDADAMKWQRSGRISVMQLQLQTSPSL